VRDTTPLTRPRDSSRRTAEVARLGRTLKMWREHVLARFESHRISNGGTEAVNLLIEKTRGLAHGFRTFEHYRLRILLAASGTPLPTSPHPRITPKRFPNGCLAVGGVLLRAQRDARAGLVGCGPGVEQSSTW